MSHDSMRADIKYNISGTSNFINSCSQVFSSLLTKCQPSGIQNQQSCKRVSHVMSITGKGLVV